MPDSTRFKGKSNNRSPYEQQKLSAMKAELLKRPNIGIEIATARLLAMLDPGDAVQEAELNQSVFDEYGLHKKFVLDLAGIIRNTVLSRGRELTPENVRKVLPL